MNFKFITIALIFLITGLSLTAQVTIGSGKEPAKGALLELKEHSATTSDLSTSTKGFLHPRVVLVDAGILDPLVAQADETPEIRQFATGMTVYNLTEDTDKGLDLGLYMWNGEEWVKLSGGMGQAVFEPVPCTSVEVMGNYVEQTPLDASNYLKLSVIIKKGGTYTITATTPNGYSFHTSGVALNPSTSPQIIQVPAMGVPQMMGKDPLQIQGIPLETGCVPQIEVKTSVATFSLLCSSAIANGAYYKSTPLLPSNTITMNVNVTALGSYYIYTEPKNGITFRGSGDFTTIGTQQVTLIGSGAPTVNEDFRVKIVANSPSGTTTCEDVNSPLIPITLPDMTYAIIGNLSDYTWRSTPRQRAISNSASESFSPTGKVKIKSFTQLWTTESTTTAGNYLTNGFTSAGKLKYPDVVLYFAYGAPPTSTLGTALASYINRGGCVIYGSADNTSSQVSDMLEKLFDGLSRPAAAVTGGSVWDNVYPISLLPNDPIINGPFGNLSTGFWGEDNDQSGSVKITTLPENSVVVCTAKSTTNTTEGDPGHAIVWYNNNKNFVYFGDSTGASLTDTSSGGYPALYSNAGAPRSKLYGPGGGKNQYSSNAALELNSIAWAIRKAAVSGINPY